MSTLSRALFLAQDPDEGCKRYEPGQWCASITKCNAATPCGEEVGGEPVSHPAEYYCTGDGLRKEVRKEGYFSTPEGDNNPTGEEPCTPGHKCIDGTKTPCQAGSFSSTPTASTCQPARKGYHVPNEADSDEIPCDPGTFAAVAGKEKCDACPEGQYTSLAGSTNCTDADPGYVVVNNRTGQSPCETGTYGQGGKCEDCSAGRYADERGLPECKPADKGFFVGTDGSSRQVMCDEGTFTDLSEQIGCKTCGLCWLVKFNFGANGTPYEAGRYHEAHHTLAGAQVKPRCA